MVKILLRHRDQHREEERGACLRQAEGGPRPHARHAPGIRVADSDRVRLDPNPTLENNKNRLGSRSSLVLSLGSGSIKSS